MKMDGEKEKKMWQILLFHHFTPKISDRGDLLPIPWTAYFRKFLPNSVNHDQDWMSIIFNPNMMNKLHPTADSIQHTPNFYRIKQALINAFLQVILSTQNVLILNLCIADILLIVFNMPLTFIELNKLYWENSFTGMVRSSSF